MPTTTNFGWTTPADTDLVKDGAAAIRTLGNGVDTSLVDLKGGTTGQVLSKASNTDLDYSWVTPNVGDITEVQAGTGISVASGTGPIPVVTNTVATAYDAKGDLIVGTGADTFAKLTVGTNGHTLVADSSTSTGLKWQAADGGKVVQIKFVNKTSVFTTTSTTFTDVTGLSVSITPTSASNKILVMCSFMLSSNSGNGYPQTRIMRDSTAIYVGDAASNRTPTFAITNLYATDGRNSSNPSTQFIDEPATTSSITYKLQARQTEGNTARIGAGGVDDDVAASARGAASIVVMEVTTS